MTRLQLKTLAGFTAAVAALSAVASTFGLCLPAIYSETQLRAAMRGQDLVTLLTSALLILAASRIGSGSARAVPAWLGLMGYHLYSFAGAAFAYAFNGLFLVYIATFSLSLGAIIWAATTIGVSHLERTFEPRAKRGSTIVFLLLVAVVLVSSELSQIVWAWFTRGTPELLQKSVGAGNFVYVLDIGVIAPLSVLAALRFAERRPGGPLLAAIMLVKCTTMGLALCAMTWFQLESGQPVEWGLSAAYAAIALLGGALLHQLLRAWHSPAPRRSHRIDAWLCGDAFTDIIAVRSSATPADLIRAFDHVTLAEMPLAHWLGRLRYLPSRFGSARARAQARSGRAFLSTLTTQGTIVLERAAEEIVVGTVGKLHQIRDQEIVSLDTPAAFMLFDAPDHERLCISLRAFSQDGETLLVLEHRTQATDEAARRKFARYWSVIRPAGAFVTRQLLRAVVRRAERERPAHRGELPVRQRLRQVV